MSADFLYSPHAVSSDKGQIEIVKAALAHRERLFDETLARAQAAGIDLAFEEDEGDEGEYSQEE